ncbi:hypothetical protein OVN18_09435 [Microcella daejeonensis]|uniref:Uncharacterized protein n=1 Tax=Microcella daejeonensis TaxID=2994971 RepID=A0A9E8MJP6_9MICO|nr:hypothetical protein [Microcella daejeonensis]WAB80787.1 hypothetical protein OVN18_09435 [Microcella daejeonensis]
MSLFTATAAAAVTESDSGWIVGIVVLVVVGLIIAAVALLGSRRKAATHRESLAADRADRADRERDRLAAAQQSDSLRNGSRPPQNLVGM